MKRILIKILVLAAVFAGSVFAFSSYYNRGEAAEVKASEGMSLPVLMIRCDGKNINSMFGYSVPMDESTLRDCITLLPYDRSLTLSLMQYDAEIEDVSFQVTSFKDGNVTENGKIKSFTEDGEMKTAQIRLENPVEMGQEYMLRFDVELKDGRVFYYYTRILQRNGQNLNWYLDYADAFYRNCLQKNITDEMYSQLEPRTSESNSSLHFVNIHSDESQLTFGELNPSLVRQAVPTVLELNETTVSIGQDYIISAQNENGDTEYYAVNEYYRMRKAQDYVVLLDFERTTEEIFDSRLPVLNETGINLGITGKDVRYRINESADIAVFVQAGELWEYDRTSGKTARIFSFRTDTHTDMRSEKQDYGLVISTLSQEGDVNFIVYGHMNSGMHEGENGILVCRYHAADNKTEELLFVPSDQGHDLLTRSVSRLAYLNDHDQFFACYGDSISSVQLNDLSAFFIQELLDWNTFAVSDSQTLVAWSEIKDGKSVSVSELNLSTGDTLRIEAPKDEQIISLGFIGEDLVYGLFREGDACKDETGRVYYPMYRICLMDKDGNVVKDFFEKGLYINSVTRDGMMLNMSCFRYEGSEQVTVPDQHIVYYETERTENVTVRLTVEDRKGTVVSLVFTQDQRTNSILTRRARVMNNENVPIVSMPRNTSSEQAYLVYAKGGLIDIYPMLSEAVNAADEMVGIVLDKGQQYVWERGNYGENAMVDTAQIPQGLLYAPIDEERISFILGDDYEVWNFSGCSLSSLKYQISNGYPVCAKWSEDENVLIIGYDSYDNIWIYDRENKEPKAIAIEEAEEAFGQAGNIFISYHAK